MVKYKGIRSFKAPRFVEFQCSRFTQRDFMFADMRFLTFYTEEEILGEYGSCRLNRAVQWFERKTEELVSTGQMLQFIDNCSVSEILIDL